MTFKETKELRSMNDKELNKELLNAQKFLNAMIFDHSQRNLKDTSQLKKVRIYKARIHTYMSERPALAAPEITEEKPVKKAATNPPARSYRIGRAERARKPRAKKASK